MIKPWSISTAVRNPARLPAFLHVFSTMKGVEWDLSTQADFQVRLIQERAYGAGKTQFYNGLTSEDIKILESGAPISYEQAERIYRRKNYKDASMRGRLSFTPLRRLGFANTVGGYIHITPLGHAMLEEKDDYGDLFLRGLIKWQIPNPIDKRSFPAKHGYNIKPFVGALCLIAKVNQICAERGWTQKGLSRREFEVFAHTLIDWRKIEETANEVVFLRERVAGQTAGRRVSFFEAEAKRLRSTFNFRHLPDYADNAIRYFRSTKYIRLRGWGDHIDIEPSRLGVLDSLLVPSAAAPTHFASKEEYAAFLGSATEPDLPGESRREMESTVETLLSNATTLGLEVEVPKFSTLSQPKLKNLLTELQQKVQIHKLLLEREELRDPVNVRDCAANLRRVMDKKESKVVGAPIRLEWLATQGLRALNDAEDIKPNYPLGDDGLPSHTAPGGKPDIECYYGDFVAICEVTMMTGSKQWIHEGQPVMRHLHEFQETHTPRDAFCIFIAPRLHADTINMFRFSVKNGYEGKRQKIAVLTIEQFSEILLYCAERQENGRPLKRGEIQQLLVCFSESLSQIEKSNTWQKQAGGVIEKWKQQEA